MSEMSHGFYNLCISFQGSFEAQELDSEFHFLKNLEFFMLTRFENFNFA